MTLPDEVARLGFDSVEAFQAAWNLGPALKVDGICGPMTRAAASHSLSRRLAGLGDLSEHFSVHELACRCGGTLPGCRKILVLRGLLTSLEGYRQRLGAPVSIVSGYRCERRNAAVGGAQHSQHIHGAAADLHPQVRDEVVYGWGLFAGIGYGSVSGLVVHVDRRDLTDHTGTLPNPAVFPDGQ